MESAIELVNAVPRGLLLLCGGIGALWLSTRAFGFLQALVNIFLLSGVNLRRYAKKGAWAVVTGASDGLGKEFATQLASQGYNLILVSRTESKLEVLAQDLETKHAGLQVKVLAMDFSQNNSADYQRLHDLIQGLDVAILINNVGLSHSIPVPFLQTPKEEMENIISVNCIGTLKVTQIVAPLLVERKRGLILTMGSFAGWMPTPYLATYSGSKAFLQHWSSALAQELQGSGVDVHLVISYLVTTAMSKIRRSSLMIPTPKPFVHAALSKVGLGSQNAIGYTYAPWWSHALLQWVVENTFGAGNRLLIWYNLKMHADIRKRALRKAEREAKKA